jgi:putative MATE family efflux protein
MRDFTSGNILKQILFFSVPMLIGNLFQQMYSMVDAMVVGRFVSGNALAAVGVASNVLGLLVAVLIGLTTGASVLISQFFGARQEEKLKATVSTSVVFLAILSVVIAVTGFIFSPALVELLNADEVFRDDTVLYMRICMAGMVFPVFYNMYTAYLRALGDSRSPLFILICCTVLNTGLDLLFVIAFDWGVAGAAIATIISQFVSAVLCFIYTSKKVPLLTVQRLSFDWQLFKLVLKYGTPAAIQLSLVNIASLTITRLINSFGAASMAGITASSKIDQFAIMPVSNVSLALSTFAAQNIGAGNEERACNGLRTALLMMVVMAATLSGLVVLFGPLLMTLFLNADEASSAEILRVGLEYLNIIASFYFLFAILFAFNGFFRGVGDAVIAMVFPVASLTLRTVSAYMLVNLAGMGPEALGWSIPIGWGVTGLASFVYYRKRLWVGKMIVKAR